MRKWLAAWAARRWICVRVFGRAGLAGLALSTAALVVAAPADIARGLEWLQAQVQSDGSLLAQPNDGAHQLARCETAATLIKLVGDDSKVASLLARLESPDSATQTLACRQELQQKLGQTILVSDLDARRISQQGYASFEGFAVASAVDTGWALAAQLQNLGSTDAQNVIAWLQASQSADGSFATAGTPDLLATTSILRSLHQASSLNANAATVASRAASFLLGKVDQQGAWLDDTAVTALVFESVHPYSAVQPTLAAQVESYLLGKQSADGSWSSDPYKVDAKDTARVIFVSYGAGQYYLSPGVLRVLDGATGVELFNVPATTLGACTQCGLAIADLDNDGKPEIIGAKTSGGPFVLRNNGALWWQGSGTTANPSVAEIEGDGKPEILFGNQIYFNTGGIKKTLSISPAYLQSTAVDFRGDGSPPNIAVGSTIFTSDGVPVGAVRYSTTGFHAFGRFGAEAEPQLVAVDAGKLYFIDKTSSVVRTQTLPGGGAGGAPVVADMDGDGIPEVGVAASTRYTAFRGDGSVLWSVPIVDPSANTGSTVFDFDGDGRAEVNGTLGQLDTSRYQNSLYQIALRVVDVNGQETLASVTVEFVGNLKLGQFRLSFADVRAEAPGLPLMITRTYDSAKKDILGDFGWGWSAAAQDVTVRKNMTLGVSWVVEARGLQSCLVPVGRRRISVNLPDGGLYRFDAKNEPECGFGQTPVVNVVFTPVPGPTGGAGGRVSAGAQLQHLDGSNALAQGGMLVDSDSGLPWNPKDFELTTEEGFKYQLKEGQGILSVTDPYGNKVTYGANGYTHNATLSVSFIRDALGRITQASDPAGKSLAYAYNAHGELESVTDREGKVTKFSYASVSGANTGAASGNADIKHLLASITDPRGQVVMSNQFDALGRLTGTADALGQAAQQEFDTANNKQTVTDRRGNKSVYSFDADGNITQVVNPLGQTSTYTFDANGNETSVTNALGEKTERTFDAVTGKQLTEKNALGYTTSTAYPAVGRSYERLNPVSTTDARGNSTSYGYEDLKQPGATPVSISEPLARVTGLTLDLKGQLRALDIAGEKTTYQYDSLGRKVQEANGLGQVTRYGYDAVGNETSRTIAKSVNGQTVTFTTTRKYDAEKRLIEEVDAMGGKTTSTYNAGGKVATQTDAQGRVTKYSYDGNARLTKTDYPDSTSELTSYDAEGNEVSKTNRAGHVSRMEYDALNRLVRTIYPDGTSESTEYDATGRVIATIDRNGKSSTMEYDAAGRQSASVDATGIRTTQAYDENGNRTSVTKADFTTRHDYDALNRLTLTTYPDGSTHSTIYRPDNRKERETDARGVITTYGYNAAGQLTSVIQSGVAGTTTYGYDETGAKMRQVDALGRPTSWTLDGNGRITSRTIQDGTTETSQYDSEGNRLTRKTFAGAARTFQYDSQNRITGEIVPAGSGGNAAIPQAAISFSYTASGQLQLQQEQGATTLNGTQSYTYDANDRLTGVKNPLGQISYSLDANGNVIEQSVSNAGTVKSEHDSAGRLVKVTAPDGKRTRYTYDAAGRVSTVERELNPKDGQQQVLVTFSRYDSASRLIAVVEVKRVGSVEALLAGQALTRITGGTITKIETYRSGNYDIATGQFSGVPAKTQAFEYDASARLTRETRAQGGATTDTMYEYDAVGNRTKKTVTTGSGAEITTYIYDQTDRLTQESTSFAAGGTKVTSYAWDGNGNLAAKTEPGKVTLHRFDPQNRLIDIRTGTTQAEAQAAAPGVSYAYDASGNRVRKGGAQASSYLIDTGHDYAQVALEINGADSTAYVRGLQLIRQTKVNGAAADDLFPLHGHLGTSMGANYLQKTGVRVDSVTLINGLVALAVWMGEVYAEECLGL